MRSTSDLIEQDAFFLRQAEKSGFVVNVETGIVYDKNGKILGHKTKRNNVHMLSIYFNKKTYGINRARIIWLYAKGAIPEGYGVSHVSEDLTDDSICNLELTTNSDRVKKNIRVHGWSLANRKVYSKLTEEMVNEDRRFERENPGSHVLLAKKRNVSVTTMRFALRGVSWLTATEPPVCISRPLRERPEPKKRVYKPLPKKIHEPKEPKVKKTKEEKRSKAESARLNGIKGGRPKKPIQEKQPKTVKIRIPKPEPYQDVKRVAKCFLLNNPEISNKGILRFLQMREMDERISLHKFSYITSQIKQEIRQKRKEQEFS
jgi:hypothetical protein